MTTQRQDPPTAPARTQALRRFVHGYAQLPAGLVGLGLLIAFAVLALSAPLYIGPDQLDVISATGDRLASPSSDYPLGTDESGRSILTLVVWGSRASLTIGVISTAMTMLLGSTIGLLAGHYQGWFGGLLMRITDWFIALPSLPMAISLAAVLGQGTLSIIIAIAITSWTRTARLVRAQTLAVSARPFVERAKALGAGDRQIMLRQVLPNVVPLILVSSTLTIASAILDAATLTFLGLGDPTKVSWGSMLNAAFAQGAVTAGAWSYLLAPGVAIVIVVLGFTLTGRAVEHVLNPRLGRTS